jgi:prepilin-type N-terminal cleavage/methylation domain-containing protein
MRRLQAAFTVIEVLIAVTIIGVVLTLAAPAMREYIVMQRLKGVNSSLVTDLQYARSEAVSRGKNVWIYFKTAGGPLTMSCYTIYTDSTPGTGSPPRRTCDCSAAAGSRCPSTSLELKTVQVPLDLGVSFAIDAGVSPSDMAFDSVTGGVFVPTLDVPGPAPTAFVVDTVLDSTRVLRTRVALSGRPQVCLPSGTFVNGGYGSC